MVRWQGQALGAQADGALPGLTAPSALVRTVTTPGFEGVRFHEVVARSALNRVPGESAMPFRWTVNPYRGCTHACVYCFARGTHSWLELDTGSGFDSEIVVKVNVVDVLRRELARPSWGREHVALGTNTDPYQRAEGRYRLMPGILRALAASGTPVSLLTKGVLLRRDLPLLASLSRQVAVGVGVSLAVWDRDLDASLEPGTPTPAARLDLVRAVRDAGLRCGVFLAPVLPGLTDSEEDLDAALARVAAGGASGVVVLPLHLRRGAREWFWAWLRREHAHLVPRYEGLYGRGAYAARSYRVMLDRRVAPLLARHGLAGAEGRNDPGVPPLPARSDAGFPAGSLPPPGEDGQLRLL
jgi:DNA repair photolyase